MELNKWLNCDMPDIAEILKKQNKDYYFREKNIGFAIKERVINILENCRAALFPSIYNKDCFNESKISIHIVNSIREAAVELADLVELFLKNDCSLTHEKNKKCKECNKKAQKLVAEFIEKLPNIRKLLHSDINAAYDGDPSAKSGVEVILSYPSFEAMSIHRIAHELYKLKVPMIPRIMSEYAHQLTGIDINPGATIQENFFIDHGTGVVIGETCIIGRNVKIYQGVTLGAKSFPLDEKGNPIKGVKRHPNIEDNVIIYSGASILGGETTIGHNSIIGGNVWLTHSVPPFSKVYNSQPSPIIE